MNAASLMRRLLAVGIVCAAQFAMARAEEAPPNVVVILSDDHAWNDYSFMGNKEIATPHIDKLAAGGATFINGYVPMSLCRPSLATIVTGLYPHQHKISGNDPPKGTPRQAMLKHIHAAPSLPRLLGEKGYVSFQSGKWWEGAPRDGGFTAGMTHGDPARGGRHGDVGLTIGRTGLKPVFDFLDSTEGKPFFLWYAPIMPHTPHQPPERLLAKHRKPGVTEPIAKYRAMVEWFDETCGELLDRMEEKGQLKNTIVVYLADNGWIQLPNAAGYDPRSKRSPYDGG
ncbi:MAG TPA: sulfatase-like hydrolase/transferase, partial [Pirellulales bacterium]